MLSFHHVSLSLFSFLAIFDKSKRQFKKKPLERTSQRLEQLGQRGQNHGFYRMHAIFSLVEHFGETGFKHVVRDFQRPRVFADFRLVVMEGL